MATAASSRDRAVSPRHLHTSPRGLIPRLHIPGDPRPEVGESRARAFTTVEKDIKGYLSRKNPRAVTTQRWIKQWYSVSGDTVSFYNTKEDEENGKTPVGSLELEGAVVQKAKEERAFQLITPKKDLTLHTASDAELSLWIEGLSGIIGALKRRQAGILEQSRDRQRLVELESRFEELLVMDLSDTAESALAAFNDARSGGRGESPSVLLSPRSTKESQSVLLSPRAPPPQQVMYSSQTMSNNAASGSVLLGGSMLMPPSGSVISPRPGSVRPLALSNPQLDDSELELPAIPSLHSPRGAPPPLPRLYFNYIFASNRVVLWFARLVKFEIQEVPLPHRRHFQAARGIEGSDMYTLPILEFVTPALVEGQPKATSWCVSETHAILRYICHSHPQAGIWYPQKLSVRIRVDEYLDWHHAVFRRAMHGLWQLTFTAALHPASRDSEQPMQKVKSLLSSSLETLDSRLSSSEFIATDEDPTIADIVAATEVNSLIIMGWDMSLYGQISRWRETMQLLDHWNTVNRQFVEFVAWLRNKDALITP